MFWWYFDVSWAVVMINGVISYIKQKFRAYTLIWMHHKHKFRFLLKSSSSEGDMTGIAFWGLKTGQKQRGCCLNARTAKTNRKTTPTLKHMLKLRKFPTDWMLGKILNGVGKASNRALNFANNTRVSMGRWIRGVRPYKTHRLNTAFL